MQTNTARLWTTLRWLAALVLALGPALAPAAVHAAPAPSSRALPRLAPLVDTPQTGPLFTVNDFADSTDGTCGETHCTLREAVLAANALPGADTITLSTGTYVLDLPGADEDAAATGDLDLTDDLTLTGVTSATTLISGTGAAFGDRLFEITSTATVTFSNVGLTGGYMPHSQYAYSLPGGGAVFNWGSLTLSASRVFSNSSEMGGGVGTSGPILITASQIDNNEAFLDGGGLYARGAITVTLTDSLVLSNTALEGGGVFGYLDARLVITNSQVLSNTAVPGGGGGGLYTLGGLWLADSLVAHNSAGYEGGGVATGTPAMISNTTILDNHITGEVGVGGGLEIVGDGPALVQNSLVLSNSAWLCGGLYFERAAAQVVGTTIAGNIATGTVGGGGLYSNISGTLAISLTQFTSNLAPAGDGGGLYAYGPVTVYSGTFTSNAAQNGGGLFGAGLVLTDSVISANTAITDGGGLYGLGYVSLTGVQAISNTAGDEGGGLYLIAEAVLSDTQVVSNTAQQGGGIRNAGMLTMTAGAVLSNTAILGGGLSNNWVVNISGTLIAHNHADLLGGGLYNLHYNPDYPAPDPFISHATIQSASFISNTSDFGGGLFNSGYLTVTDSLFDGNTAPKTYIGAGGGLANASSPAGQLPFTALISATTFQHNFALSGGGLINYDQPLELIATSFVSNSAGVGGGMLNGDFQLNPALTPTVVMTITDGLFEDNFAYAGGAIANAPNGQLSMAQSEVISNTGVASGFWNRGQLTLVNSTVNANASTGLANEISGTVTISASHFERNQSSALWNAGTLTLTSSLVLSNTTTDSGGGLYTTGPAWVTGSAFYANSATGRGGGLFAAGSLSLANVTVSGNQAGSDGGGLAALNGLVTQADVHLNNVSLVSNTTGGDGGGLYVMLTATLRLTNTLLAGNLDSGGQAPDCAGPLTSGGYNLIANPAGCTLGGDLTGVLSATAALLGPLADNGGSTLTHALLLGSPAINAGNPATPGTSACALTDQRGVPRPFGPRCDIGAYESTELPPTIQFDHSTYTVTESAGTLPFSLTLSAPSGLTVTVAYTAAPGTATPGADYVAATGTLTFAPGLTTTMGTLTLLPDALDELDETLTLTLGSPANATLGAPAAAILTLLDDDAPPSVQFSAAAYTGPESAGALLITVTLSAPSALTVTVAYTSAPGTAAAGADYLPASGVLTFAPGLVQQTISLAVLDDAAPEPAETLTLTLTLSNPSQAALGAPNTVTITLGDDDTFQLYLPLTIGSAAASRHHHGRLTT
jgi:CSLREA domain-containing protein